MAEESNITTDALATYEEEMKSWERKLPQWRDDPLMAFRHTMPQNPEHPDTLCLPSTEVIKEYWKVVEAADFNEFKHFFRRHTETPRFNPGPIVGMLNSHSQNLWHVIASTTGDVRFLWSISPSSQWLFDYRNRAPLSVTRMRVGLPVHQDDAGNTPLHIAAANDKLSFVQGLVECIEGELDEYYDIGDTDLSEWRSDETGAIRDYLHTKNLAGRTAAEEAISHGAIFTGQWLHDFETQFNGPVYVDKSDDSDSILRITSLT